MTESQLLFAAFLLIWFAVSRYEQYKLRQALKEISKELKGGK